MRTLFSNAISAAASIAITAGLVAFADPALASVPTMDPQRTVSTADLDLHSAAGLATAQRRIGNAADLVCADAGTAMAATLCRADAVRDARHALDAEVSPVVTAAN